MSKRPIRAGNTSLNDPGGDDEDENSNPTTRMRNMSDDDDEDSNIEETETHTVPITMDTYSGLLVSMLRCQSGKLRETRRASTLTIAVVVNLLMHIVNLVLQTGLLFVLVAFTIERREDEYEHRHLPVETLQAAVDSNRPLNASNPAAAHDLALCMRDHTVLGTTAAVVFLWGVKMLTEIQDAFLLTWSFWTLPLDKDDEVVRWGLEDKLMYIESMTPSLRVIVTVVIYLPKFLLAVLLWWVGAKFLIYAPTPGELIMKAMCLGFISTIDEILFAGLAAKMFKTHVTNTRLQYTTTELNVEWRNWGATVVKTALVLLATFALVQWKYGGVSHFRHVCRVYKSQFHLGCHGKNCGFVLFGVRIDDYV